MSVSQIKRSCDDWCLKATICLLYPSECSTFQAEETADRYIGSKIVAAPRRNLVNPGATVSKRNGE